MLCVFLALVSPAVIISLQVHQNPGPPPWLPEHCCWCPLLTFFVTFSASFSALASLRHSTFTFCSAFRFLWALPHAAVLPRDVLPYLQHLSPCDLYSLWILFHPLWPLNRISLSSGSRSAPLESFYALHNLSHPGVCSPRRLFSRAFMWAGLSQDVSPWARAFVECQKSKVHQHIHAAVHQIPVPSRRFCYIHFDFVGPLPSSRG